MQLVYWICYLYGWLTSTWARLVRPKRTRQSTLRYAYLRDTATPMALGNWSLPATIAVDPAAFDEVAANTLQYAFQQLCPHQRALMLLFPGDARQTTIHEALFVRPVGFSLDYTVMPSVAVDAFKFRGLELHDGDGNVLYQWSRADMLTFYTRVPNAWIGTRVFWLWLTNKALPDTFFVYARSGSAPLLLGDQDDVIAKERAWEFRKLSVIG